LLQTAEPV